jgi:hypothetical protein
MQKKLLIFSLAFLLIGAPLMAAPMLLEMGVAEMIDEPAVTITVSEKTVTVNGAQGETLEVVSLTGRPVASYKIESPSQRVELNLAKGCYILKVGKVVRKISIR